MKIYFLKPTAYLVLLFGVLFGVASCEKDDSEAMELPPAESLMIDWSKFPSNENKSTEEAAVIYGNYLYSLETVVVWNRVVAANMAIPAVAYSAAFDHTPVYKGNNTWEWSYSVTSFNQRTILARLTGTRINKDTYSMEMVLSEAGGFDEFKWFEGVIRYDRTAANWTMRHSPDNPVDYLAIAYEKDLETTVTNIRYTVVDQENDFYNGYVEFGIDPELNDARYTVSGSDSTTLIEWNTSNYMGRVKAQHHFGNLNWHCWDTLLQDVECPAEE